MSTALNGCIFTDSLASILEFKPYNKNEYPIEDIINSLKIPGNAKRLLTLYYNEGCRAKFKSMAALTAAKILSLDRKTIQNLNRTLEELGHIKIKRCGYKQSNQVLLILTDAQIQYIHQYPDRKSSKTTVYLHGKNLPTSYSSDQEYDKDLNQDLSASLPTEVKSTKSAKEFELNFSKPFLNPEEDCMPTIEDRPTSESKPIKSFMDALGRAKTMTDEERISQYKKMRQEGEQDGLMRIQAARESQREAIKRDMVVEEVSFDRTHVSIWLDGFEEAFRIENFVFEKIKMIQREFSKEQLQEIIYSVDSPTNGKTQMHQLNSTLYCLRAGSWKTPWELLKVREEMRIEDKNQPLSLAAQRLIASTGLLGR